MTGYFRTVAALVGKDLLLEWRGRETLTSMALFSVLLVVVFGFAFQAQAIDPGSQAPGLLWIAFTFSGVLGLHRTMAVERENGCLKALLLAPIERSAIFLAKFIVNVILLAVMEIVTVPLFSILLRVSVLPCLPELALIAFAGTVGFASVGTLLSTISSGSRLREVLLPILLYPLWVPIVVASVELTGYALTGRPMWEGTDWWTLIVVYDVVFLAAGTLLFDVMLEE
ncbi:MAG: heme exporter protein CcmB [Candidatus Eisenbacteria bacterium]|uniref:Heme exporter protein B n=1 Tax=Eiseniibacteriota bacterium TaxID=2212470 RepID=A0A956SBC9_UNCEI|nr:heme exporter protein CcmB [Candidatus Eisenbacteria bacterium]MCB9463033.1 heme exporter protein CcmB [Candidatus Eisenbacteria bacterium]